MSPFAKLVKDLIREDQSRQRLAEASALIDRTHAATARMQKCLGEVDVALGVMVKAYVEDEKRQQAKDKAEFRRRFADLNALGNMAASLGHLSPTEAAKMDQRLDDIGRRAKAAGL